MTKKIVFIVLGILLLDQIVKIWVKTHFAPGETVTVIDGFFQMYYIENRGMAFGTTLGNGSWAKYALSIFRLLACAGIIYYIRKLIKDGQTSFTMVLSIALIFAGAFGNLLDSMFYDLIWDVNPDIAWNWVRDSNGNWEITENGGPVIRDSGFLLGSVVDMWQFTAKWPSWMPLGLGGKEIFSAIWNIADAAITFGVIMIVLRYRTMFKKVSPKAETTPAVNEEE